MRILQTMFGFLIQVFLSLRDLLSWIKALFLKLRSKHGPRIAIGQDYLRQNDAHPHRPPASIKKLDGVSGRTKGGEIMSVPYGPLYSSWAKGDIWKILKQNSWNHILESSKTAVEKKTIEDVYHAAIKKVEDDSRELYGRDDSIDLLSSNEFRTMMILDGCFFLQVALAVLGGFKRLNHLRDFDLLIPGSLKENTTTMIKVAMSSMFIIGNQIPLLVLKVLMKQDFFRDFVRQGIWEEPSDMERWVLYELLLVPMFQGGERNGTIIQIDSLLNFFSEKRNSFLSYMPNLRFRSGREVSFQMKKNPLEKATDIIDGLWLLLTGLDDSAGDVDKDGKHSSYSTIPDCHGGYNFVLPTVRSATELKQAGVDFRHKGKTRINGIRFRNTMFSASLNVPQMTIVFEEELYTVLHDLIRYEERKFGEGRRKVCEYLQLMRGLVRSEDDAKVLIADGVIVVGIVSDDAKVPIDVPPREEVLGFFKRLDKISQLRSHRSLVRSVKDDLNNYTKPSHYKKLGDVLNFVVFLTVIQTFMSVYSYAKPPDSGGTTGSSNNSPTTM